MLKANLMTISKLTDQHKLIHLPLYNGWLLFIWLMQSAKACINLLVMKLLGSSDHASLERFLWPNVSQNKRYKNVVRDTVVFCLTGFVIFILYRWVNKQWVCLVKH